MATRIALGVHIGHDRGAAVVANGKLIGALSQERVDRRKHSPSPEIPHLAIDRLLAYLSISPSHLSAVGVSYTNVRIAEVIDQIADELRDRYRLGSVPVVPVSHHAAHASAAFYTSPFPSALVLVADGSGDIVGESLEAESLYLGNRNGLQLLDRRLQQFALTHSTRRNFFNLAYMHPMDREKQTSLGRKYEQVTYLLGFSHGQAGHTMGLASYGQPLIPYRVPIEGLGFSLTVADLIDELEECRREQELPFHRFIAEHRANIAATVQNVVEQAVVDLLNSIHRANPSGQLCLAGGLFLNCVLNHRILGDTPFKELYVLPPAGDDGQAIGSAFASFAAVSTGLQPAGLPSPYLGISYSQADIQATIDHFALEASELPEEELVARTAALLDQGSVVGILRGRSEIGPRALCHRSILADPRRHRMRQHINDSVKYRASFRPLAPVVVADEQFRYFDLHQESPHMLFAAPVRSASRSDLQAITHVDGTARVQAVSQSEDAFVYDLLRAFEALAGVPVLINTSFNLSDEPIVESPHDAVSTFLRSNIDVLILENYLIESKESASLQDRKPVPIHGVGETPELRTGCEE
jgi:carbamoyltransferase